MIEIDSIISLKLIRPRNLPYLDYGHQLNPAADATEEFFIGH